MKARGKSPEKKIVDIGSESTLHENQILFLAHVQGAGEKTGFQRSVESNQVILLCLWFFVYALLRFEMSRLIGK